MDSIEIRQTERFAHGFKDLRDDRARSRILVRIRRLSLGNPGDVRPVGGGVSEIRVDHGPGDRVYFTARGSALVILLAGGDKRTQARDIALARELANSLLTTETGMKRKIVPTTKPWDAPNHLKTEREMAAYLQAALDDGDDAVVAAAVGDIARAVGMTTVARAAGVGRESLYKSLSRNGNPELITVLRVLRAVGLRLHARPA